MSLKNKTALLWAEIDLAALAGNLRVIRRWMRSSSAGIIAVVKADAYGHGMAEAARTLWREGIRFFGVASIDEALALRKILPRARILTLGTFHPHQIAAYEAARITPTLSSEEDAVLLNAKLKGKALFPVHLKIDTGMGRLGLPYRKTEEFVLRLRSLRRLSLEGVYTHFSSADDGPPTQRQLDLFLSCLGRIRRANFSPKYIHASNSLGLLRFKKAHFDLVRPGILLYGLNPSARHPLPSGMRPVLSWKTRISFLKEFEAGQTVSYGRTHRVSKKTLIAVLPVGYSHGYRVAFSNRSFVLVRGRRCPVVGRVTMDQTLVDVGAVKGVRRWDEAVLIGRAGKEHVSAEELAGIAGTIPYEIVCSIHPRVPRLYKP